MKKNKKMFYTIGGISLLIIAVISLGYLGFLQKGYYLFQEPQLCSDAQFDDECYCLEGYEKLTVNRVVDSYFCESEDKLVNVDITGWESDAITEAKKKLTDAYPECNMIQCDKGNAEIITEWGYRTSYKERFVNVECKEAITGTKGRIFWDVEFDIVEGNELSPYGFHCADYVAPPSDFGEIDFHGPYQDRARSGYVDHLGSIYSKCGEGIVEDTKTFGGNLIGRYPLVSFELLNVMSGVDCEITDQDIENHRVTIRCDTHCPHEDMLDKNDGIKIRMNLRDMSNYCGRDGTRGAIESGMYYCQWGYKLDPTIEKSIVYCENGVRTWVKKGLATCKAPFWGTPDMNSIEYTEMALQG